MKEAIFKIRYMFLSLKEALLFLAPRLVFSSIFAVFLSSNSLLVENLLPQLLLPIFGNDRRLYAVFIVGLFLSFEWTIYEIFIRTVRALGYQTQKDRVINFQSSIIKFDENSKGGGKDGLEIDKNNNENNLALHAFRRGDPLRAFESARDRLQEHISRLQSNAVVNLISAIVTAIVGIAVLGTAFLEIEKYHDANMQSFRVQDFIIVSILPRLTISIFIQIFAYFFLITYRSNLNDVKYFQNENTNLDYHAAAISLATKNNFSNSHRNIVNSMMKVERNRLINKNQKVITSNDDEKILARLSEINQKISHIPKIGRDNDYP